MKSFFCFMVGIVCGLLVGVLLVTKGRSAELKDQQIYVSQVQSDLAGEKQVTVDDLKANVQTTLASPQYGKMGLTHVATGDEHLSQNEIKNVADFISHMASGNLSTISTKPEWQIHIDWAARNHDAGGATNCPSDYFAQGEGWCVVAGGRSCVITDATRIANNLYKENNGNAGENLQKIQSFVLLTQCHNDEAKAVLSGVNIVNIANYLKSMGK